MYSSEQNEAKSHFVLKSVLNSNLVPPNTQFEWILNKTIQKVVDNVLQKVSRVYRFVQHPTVVDSNEQRWTKISSNFILFNSLSGWVISVYFLSWILFKIAKLLFFFSHLKIKPKLQNSNITVRGKPKSSLGQVFHSKLGRFAKYCKFSPCHTHDLF